MQTVAADGQHTSFQPARGSFNRFIFIDEFSSIIGWMHGEPELNVSNLTNVMELLLSVYL